MLNNFCAEVHLSTFTLLPVSSSVVLSETSAKTDKMTGSSGIFHFYYCSRHSIVVDGIKVALWPRVYAFCLVHSTNVNRLLGLRNFVT